MTGLKPGSSQDNLIIKSINLPGIVYYYSQGYVELISFPYGAAEDVEPEEIKNYFLNSVKGTTLGPVEPPEVFDPLSFIEKIIAYKEEARQLGWIDDPAVITSISQKLNNARDFIYNDRPSAINLLNALLGELDAQRGQHVNDEAYFLLKYNVKYLLDRI